MCFLRSFSFIHSMFVKPWVCLKWKWFAILWSTLVFQILWLQIFLIIRTILKVKNCLIQSLLLWTDQSVNIFFLFLTTQFSVSLKTCCIMLTSSHSTVKIFEMISVVVDQGSGVFIYTTASVTAELLRTACLNFTIQVLTAQTVFLIKEINCFWVKQNGSSVRLSVCGTFSFFLRIFQ